MGPGAYDPDRADGITKTKVVGVTMDTSAADRASYIQDKNTIGPGQYEETKQFGSESKTFTIGERRFEKVRETSLGPGAYSPERADGVTMTKMVNIHMGSSPARTEIVSKTSTSVGPGAYTYEKRFGEETKTFRIGERREEKVVETMGPGLYDVERGDAITRVRSTNINMGTSPTRRDGFIK